ncbi:MAG: transcriptional regulator [Desulfobulbaceae bacterium BRH_c16a]|nr:MAG: transcriptional regulator [Desulfobulbaceae bacterium BRH_c16a]
MENFLKTYKLLNAGNLELLENIYSDDIRFVDPAHEIVGLARLKEYFADLYANVTSIEFEFLHEIRLGDEGYVQWRMTFSHRFLKGGRPINVEGASYVQFDISNKVCSHRDYFDLGAMLYEQLPVLGTVVIALKRRMRQ